MTNKLIAFFILISTLCHYSCRAQQSVIESLDRDADKYAEIAQQIWNNPELGYQEIQSSRLLQQTLADAGFEIEVGVAGIPTAFVASYGQGAPVIGLLAEYDALPGISQQAIPMRQEVEKGGNGHACGHHLFGTASTAAAIAAKEWMINNNISGTIKLIGTPAEEGGAGKVYMVRAGVFEDIDAVLHWHPGNQNNAGAYSSLANKSAKFRFYGIASHAAVAPQNGRSALDGVEAMNYMVNLMREHVSADTRIHYVITSGGEAPNVVPEFAEVFYYVRHPEMDMVRETFDRVVQAAEGAALGTETTMEYEVIHGVYNLMPNETLAKITHDNLTDIGGFTYTDAEKEFAEKISSTLPERSRQSLSITEQIRPFRVVEKGAGGSTDVGDVSWVVPTAGLSTATWVPGTSPHTWQAVAAGGMSIGHKGMMLAAKTLSQTILDLLNNTDSIKRAKEELSKRVGNKFRYEALLGDRSPPLDYRQ